MWFYDFFLAIQGLRIQVDFPHIYKDTVDGRQAKRQATWRPLRSSSLWIATADTHLETPPCLALLMLNIAIRSVAPWSLWNTRRFKSKGRPLFSSYRSAWGYTASLFTAGIASLSLSTDTSFSLDQTRRKSRSSYVHNAIAKHNAEHSFRKSLVLVQVVLNIVES